jgi:murein DD-endopeptidase MepM/ murein hydrolase activator NlpD
MSTYAVRYYQPKCAKEGFFRRTYTRYYDELHFVTSSILLVIVFFGLFFLTLPFLHFNFKNIPSSALAQPTVHTVDQSTRIAAKTLDRNIQVKDPTTGVYVNTSMKVEWPLHGPITLEFGAPDYPYMPVHSGLDIAARTGAPIVPIMPGKVVYAGEISWGYGKHIIIDHGNGIQSIYAHLSAINVHVGQDVQMEQVIGLVGQTGWATGPHLHFQVNISDKPINPRIFLGYGN